MLQRCKTYSQHFFAREQNFLVQKWLFQVELQKWPFPLKVWLILQLKYCDCFHLPFIPSFYYNKKACYPLLSSCRCWKYQASFLSLQKSHTLCFYFCAIVFKLRVFIHLDPLLVPVNPPTPTGRNESRCQQHVASQTRSGWFCYLRQEIISH